MSIVPINGQQGTVSNPSSLDLWDPFNNFDPWNPFTDGFPFTFPSFLSTPFAGFTSEIFPSLATQVNWRETPRAHVFKAYLPGVTRDEVIVFIDDDRMLQISTENGNFMSRFKLPENARTEQIQGFMENGMLIVTIGKEAQATERPNVRVVEITE
ncbi:18.5 kDa class IV heat shock protein-like [Durio zibethinus]|uniref:18.5 kDa class IV heat shock protein-like n=1 Tax=Durio zibethinus TaxID=66656 RepID=A0A6P5YGG7_DURZI|nr:18.5 kDa class IV heat shock protein-like [Durio zibethinus]